MQRDLGVEGRVVESRLPDYVPNMTSLVRKGYDLIIGVGFAQGDAIATAAKRFPNVKFAIVDVDQAYLKGKPTNVEAGCCSARSRWATSSATSRR